MNPLTRSLRSGAVAAAAATALLTFTAPAALAAGSTAEVTVDHDCTSIDVSSTKDISNVVLEFADGDTQRFEDLPERETGTFAGTGANSGDVITTAWIKSGDNKSGDGPGYGERFDFDADDCDGTSATTAATSDSGSQGNDTDDGPKGPKGPKADDGPKGPQGPKGGDSPDGDQGATVRATTAGSDDTDGGSEEIDDAANESNQSNEAGDDTDDSDTNGTTGETAVANTVATTGDEVTGDDGELPAARVLSGVLTATAEREAGADAGLRAADVGEVRSAGLLPNTGADILLALAGALGALALGGGLLRRARRDAA